MDVLDCINHRASVRSFKDEAVNATDLDTLVNAALRAPSAGNLLHYSIVAVQDPAVKDRLFDLLGKQPFVKKAPLVLVFNVDEHRIKMWLDRWGGDFHFDGPYVFHIAFSDALIASENVVLAADAIGLGSVYVGNVIGQARAIRELLGYPEYVVPVALLCIGRPDRQPEKRGRLPVRAILHMNRYQDYTAAEIEAIYGELESDWKSTNPNGLRAPSGKIVRSRAEWTMDAHYTKEHIRGGDEEMKEAVSRAGFKS